MARFILKDMQTVLRGLRQVTQSGLNYQLTEATLRWKTSSFVPLAQNVLLNCNRKQETSNFADIPARVGAVFQGLKEEVKILSGISSPALVTPEGFVFYTDKYDKSSQHREYPAVSDEAHSAKQKGVKGVKSNGEASEAAKRAREFMNPPIAPMDPEDKNEVFKTPEMRDCQTDSDMAEADKAAKRLGKFMNKEVIHEDKKFKKDSKKSHIKFHRWR